MESAPLTLPSGWDPARDLAVLIGARTAPVAHRLAEMGQERLFAWLDGSLEPITPADWPGRARLVRSRAALLAAIAELPGRLPSQVFLHGAQGECPERMESASRTLLDAIRWKGLMRNTNHILGSTWLRQGMANLPHVARHASVGALTGAFAGVPCVLVSPGPSLSRNVHLLPQVAERALVIAGTHSAGAFTHAGLAPDLLMAADPGDLARHLEGLDLERVGAYVIGATCRSDNFERPAQRRFTFASNGALDDWIFEALEEDARLLCGGSVACSAFGLALAMGCDPIILVGQDLSFPDGRAYAAETIDGDARVRVDGDRSFHLRKPAESTGFGKRLPDGELHFARTQQRMDVPAYDGGTVPTNQTFYSYLKWFEAMAETHGRRVRLINATEGGARIEGMEQLPLAHVLEQLDGPRPDVAAVLDRATHSIDPHARAARLGEHVVGVRAGLRRCLDLAQRCQRLATLAAEDERALAELGIEEQRLGRSLKPLKVLSLAIQEEILQFQERGRGATTLEESLAASQELFRLVARGAGELLEALGGVLGGLTGMGRRVA